MYYDYRTGIYYTYNQEKNTYDFYTQVAVNSSSTASKETTSKDATKNPSEQRSERGSSSKTNKVLEEKSVDIDIDIVESGSEDGEIVEVQEVEKETPGVYVLRING